MACSAEKVAELQTAEEDIESDLDDLTPVPERKSEEKSLGGLKLAGVGHAVQQKQAFKQIDEQQLLGDLVVIAFTLPNGSSQSLPVRIDYCIFLVLVVPLIPLVFFLACFDSLKWGTPLSLSNTQLLINFTFHTMIMYVVLSLFCFHAVFLLLAFRSCRCLS